MRESDWLREGGRSGCRSYSGCICKGGQAGLIIVLDIVCEQEKQMLRSFVVVKEKSVVGSDCAGGDRWRRPGLGNQFCFGDCKLDVLGVLRCVIFFIPLMETTTVHPWGGLFPSKMSPGFLHLSSSPLLLPARFSNLQLFSLCLSLPCKVILPTYSIGSVNTRSMFVNPQR